MLREDLVNTLLGNPYDAEFSLTVGDIVFDNLGLYDRHKEMMGLIGIPQWNLPGNHDVEFRVAERPLCERDLQETLRTDVLLVQLRKRACRGPEQRRVRGCRTTGFDGNVYRGFISENQLYWLERDLAHVPPDRLIVIATHISLISEASDGDPHMT